MRTLFKILYLFFILASQIPSGFCDALSSHAKPEVSWQHKVVTGAFQKEIDKLAPNSTLKIPKGIYYGPIDIKTPGITLIGDPGAVITGNGKDSVVVIEADNVTVQGFTVKGSGLSYTQADAGIGLRNANNVKILNNHIQDCLFGIDVYAGENILLDSNYITSKNLELGLRGDAIRLWNVAQSNVTNNRWEYSRDVVAWYSKKIFFRKNTGTDSRYSIHSMYSQGITIQDNVFKRNQVGIFLMYGKDFVITGNFIERALGAAGMGIGLKESSSIIAQNNTINYSAIGILVDSSPFNMGTRNWIYSNTLAFNGKGVLLSNDLKGGEFKRNSFIGNMIDVDTDRRTGTNSLWDKNYWDKYEGFDLDKNNIGDKPYIIKKFGDTIKGSDPKLAFFNGTPLFSLIDIIEEVANVGDPIIVLKDEHPHILKD